MSCIDCRCSYCTGSQLSQEWITFIGKSVLDLLAEFGEFGNWFCVVVCGYLLVHVFKLNYFRLLVDIIIISGE